MQIDLYNGSKTVVGWLVTTRGKCTWLVISTILSKPNKLQS